MLDHMPEQYPIAGHRVRAALGLDAGRRRGAGRERRALDAVHYLTCYVMTDPVEETLREFYEHGRALGKVGRFHQHRRALMSGPFRIVDGVAAARVLIRAESVPFRPHRGIYVVVEGAGVSDTAAARSRAHERTGRHRLLGRSCPARSRTRTRGNPATSASRSPGSTKSRTRPRPALAPVEQRARGRDLRRPVRDDHPVGVDLVRLTDVPTARRPARAQA